MTTEQLTGILLIVVPVMFNVIFFLLQRAFEYPDILRRPTSEVLTRFHEGGRRLVALWYLFVVSSLLFVPVTILIPQVLAPDDRLFVIAATTFGVLAGLVQVLGLIRWPFLVPHLARAYSSPTATQATRDAIDLVFQAFHRYAGAALGEHLGYLFTSIWTILVAVAMAHSPFSPHGWAGSGSFLLRESFLVSLKRPASNQRERSMQSATSFGPSGSWLPGSSFFSDRGQSAPSLLSLIRAMFDLMACHTRRTLRGC